MKGLSLGVGLVLSSALILEFHALGHPTPPPKVRTEELAPSIQKLSGHLRTVSELTTPARLECVPSSARDQSNKAETTSPCNYWDLSNLDRKKVAEIEPLGANFAKLYEKNPISAIKQWLLSTKTFKGVPPSGVGVAARKPEKGGNKEIAGVYNKGIFTVNVVKPKASYVIKVNRADLWNESGKVVPRCGELERLENLNHSVFTHPECLCPDLPAEKLKNLPAVAKVVESGRAGDLCFGVLEQASGESLRSIVDDLISSDRGVEEGNKIFADVGVQVGALHSYFARRSGKDGEDPETGIHGDLHLGNIFYDKIQKKMTLIDNSTLGGGRKLLDPENGSLDPDPETVQYDLYQLLGRELVKRSQAVFGQSDRVAMSENRRNKQQLSQDDEALARMTKFYVSFSKSYLKQFTGPVSGPMKAKLAEMLAGYCLDALRQRGEGNQEQAEPSKAANKASKPQLIRVRPRNPDLVKCSRAEFD